MLVKDKHHHTDVSFDSFNSIKDAEIGYYFTLQFKHPASLRFFLLSPLHMTHMWRKRKISKKKHSLSEFSDLSTEDRRCHVSEAGKNLDAVRPRFTRKLQQLKVKNYSFLGELKCVRFTSYSY